MTSLCSLSYGVNGQMLVVVFLHKNAIAASIFDAPGKLRVVGWFGPRAVVVAVGYLQEDFALTPASRV